ncbi:MAG: twin-arginine translocation signal domain-containing protein, partial [Phycisphaerae bacterium]|nr:twin-arginine translocation signal domain-containing protein [Phycisphaerae bacterium]
MSIEKTNVNRRDFLKTLSFGAAALTIPGCVRAASRVNYKTPRHPNIVFVMADDM